MRVVVTGATGFVGSALAQALVKRGDEVVALARPTSDRSRLAETAVEWAMADVTEPDSLQGVFAGADAVIHSAGMLGQAGVADEVYMRLNVEGTRHVLAEAVAAGVGRVLHVSSTGVIGPVGDEAAGEDAPLFPDTPYEKSKALAEDVVLGFVREQGVNGVIARPSFLYGPGDTHVLGLFKAIEKGQFFYIDGGKALCHPAFIEDAVQGMLLCLDHGRAGEIYHVTGERPVSFKEFGETVAQVLGVRPPWLNLPRPLAKLLINGLNTLCELVTIQPPLTRTAVSFFGDNRYYDWSKSADALGYRPCVDLPEGVERTIAWYRANDLWK